MEHKKRKKKAALRTSLKIGCVVLGLIFVILLGGTIYAEHLLNQLNYHTEQPRETMSLEDAQALIQEETDPTDESVDATEMEAEDVQLETVDKVLHTSENVINILLIGADYQSSSGTARSDSMILCTFNKHTNTITMTSILRDLYVRIPGYYKTRINTSYAIGGMDLLLKTLEHNFGLKVDGVVEVDFSGFEQLIDLLGGVEIELNSAEASFINLKNHDSLRAGVHTLNGAQALWYSRYRGDASGDFGRTNRQRVVLGKLMENYRDISLTDLMSIMGDILPMITTNMAKSDILNYALDLFPMLSTAELVTQRIPAEGGYYLTKIDGKSVMVPDISFNVKILEDTMATD